MESMTSAGFAVWTVFRRDPSLPLSGTTDQIETLVASWADRGVVTRGFYDVSGLRADADVMVWLHAETAEALQQAIRELRRTGLFAGLPVTWSSMGVHRDAEFNRSHVPGFLRGEPAREWLSVYPFVRSFDWYVLPDEDRGRMLAEHGRKGAAYRSVVANTVAAFALGDYEWILPMESDVLTDLVDMMRELRATDARLHVREEVPFFTGRRISVAELSEVLS
ncbi:hydrogen peroxide-dependent heme synthase [Amnibacterium flavum]|uniref:Coproheme decarboxylase n=1 Tax=Amnibacterium flavum TaxID=2173173 RepID=A0A2V1HT56_9MICO|nr:hydrogen peroxide-dependent heme synthase [Amnibacterium flavum]PVZ95521.1 chlorite dismutase [Amnibacterium flavum]